jgi:cytochrome oxidase assembly protein ShyY1
MMTASNFRLRFDFEWRLALFTALLVPLMVGLGFWQLHRAEEKAGLAAAFAARQQQPPAPLPGLWDQPAELLAYTPVHMRGRFVPGVYFLLDNQTRDGQVGYEVLSVMQLADAGGRVLVNRGWLAGGADRQALPLVPTVDGQVNITGHVYVAPGTPFLLAEQQFDNNWPKRVQAIEMDKFMPLIAERAAGRVFPYPVRIDAGEPGALAVDWQIMNATPQKHQAYAVQWFAMAATLFVFYLLRSSNVWQLLSGSGRADK